MKKFFLLSWITFGLFFLVLSIFTVEKVASYEERKERALKKNAVFPLLSRLETQLKEVEKFENRFLNWSGEADLNIEKVLDTREFHYFSLGEHLLITRKDPPGRYLLSLFKGFVSLSDSWPNVVGVFTGSPEEAGIIKKSYADLPDLNVLLLANPGVSPPYLVREKGGVKFLYSLDGFLRFFKSIPFEYGVVDGKGNVISGNLESKGEKFIEIPLQIGSMRLLIPMERPDYFKYFPAAIFVILLFGTLVILSQEMNIKRSVDYILKLKDRWREGTYEDYAESGRQELDALVFEFQEILESERKKRIEGLLDIVRFIAEIVDERDPYLMGHSINVAKISELMALQFKLPRERIIDLKLAAYLHDISKLLVPETIFYKTTSLIREERELLREAHKRVLEYLEGIHTLKDVVQILKYVHERYDGKGYPEGLVGEEIPLESRIISVADAFETMRRRRSYRYPLGISEIRRVLMEESGRAWDPKVVRALLKVMDELDLTFAGEDRGNFKRTLKEYMNTILQRN